MDTNIIFTELVMARLALHRVGNKSRDEGIKAAKKLLPLQDADMTGTLLSYFLSSFKMDELYRFDHVSDLAMNEIFTYCSYIFDEPNKDVFYEQSIHILQHLYNCSNHNKIKDGELYVAYFENCIIDDEAVDAIGIFKAETKERYLKLRLDAEEDWELYFEEGTDVNKLDKGCIIFNTQKEEGYRVINVDLKSSGEAKYWRDEFLMLTQIRDGGFYTKTYMNLCKEFGKTQFEKDEKQEQVSFINKSLDYFNTKETFDFDEFAAEVLDDEEKVETFRQYKSSFQEKQGLEPEEDSFFIATPVVKKAQRSFKNIIQLDTQVEIKIQSVQAQEEGVVERGYDEERGMHFYKIFFNEEQ